jgi:3'(2'), 5'-bisphosphate nucleotidase
MTGNIRSHGYGELTHLLSPLTELVALAGGKILDIAKGSLGAREKLDHSPVTTADLAAEEILREGLAQLLPGVPFIAEESVSHGDIPEPGKEFLLIDPLDGTLEFIAGRDEYTVNVGLVADGVPILGAIYAPAECVVYAGAEGTAFRAPLTPGASFDLKNASRIHARARPSKLVAAISRSFPDKASEAFLATLPIKRRLILGSSLKFVRLAEGEVDVYPRLASISEWDVAAGHALLSAAGGRVETQDGQPIHYGRKDKNFRLEAFVAWGAKSNQ